MKKDESSCNTNGYRQFVVLLDQFNPDTTVILKIYCVYSQIAGADVVDTLSQISHKVCSSGLQLLVTIPK